MPQLSVENLTVRYGRRVAVAGVTFDADCGVICLLGPNGAGKSTLMNALAGVQKPDVGHVSIAPQTHATSTHARPPSIGYLPQRFDLVGGLTSVATVKYAAWCNRVPRALLRSAATEALQAVDLLSCSHTKVRKLSGGQRQRLGLAAAVAHRPNILLLDEPTIGFDPEQRIVFRRFVKEAAESTCVILATHQLEDSQLVGDRILVLNDGAIQFDGTAAALADRGDSISGQPHESTLERGYRAAISNAGHHGE
jgi:ABC-2 type transport system ATP-binding protein